MYKKDNYISNDRGHYALRGRLLEAQQQRLNSPLKRPYIWGNSRKKK